ncbi:uncharacterized protein LOC144106694 [Amblyomma americanum]
MASGESGPPPADHPPSVSSATEAEDPTTAVSPSSSFSPPPVVSPSEDGGSYDPQKGDDVLTPNASFITSIARRTEAEVPYPTTVAEGVEQRPLYTTASWRATRDTCSSSSSR